MKKIILFVLCLIFSSVCSLLIASDLGLWIRTVKSKIIDQSLIRTIGHNMEREPSIKIERFSIPGPDYIETNTIKRITTQYTVGKIHHNYMIDFEQAASIELCQLQFNEKQVYFSLDYFPPDQGIALFIECLVDVSNNRITEPHCNAIRLNVDLNCNLPQTNPSS